MKDENLPEIIEKEKLPFSFKRQQVSVEDIRIHWNRIAARISEHGWSKNPEDKQEDKQ